MVFLNDFYNTINTLAYTNIKVVKDPLFSSQFLFFFCYEIMHKPFFISYGELLDCIMYVRAAEWVLLTCVLSRADLETSLS